VTRRIRPREELDLELPELRDLELPVALPGEDFPRSRPLQPGVPLEPWWGEFEPMIVHDRTGKLIGSKLRKWELFKLSPNNHYLSPFLFREGNELHVSTVFLGIDCNYLASHQDPPGPALLWETMIGWSNKQGGGMIGDHQWRYSTRNAALNGHRRVYHAIWLANRHAAFLRHGYPAGPCLDRSTRYWRARSKILAVAR
jgi:hypothetical protein